MKNITKLFYKKGKINKINIGVISIIIIFTVVLSYFGVIAVQNSRIAGSWVTENNSPQQWTFDIFGRQRIYEYPLRNCNQRCGYGEGTYKVKGDDIIFNNTTIVHFKITTTNNRTCMTMSSDSKSVFVGTMCRLQ